MNKRPKEKKTGGEFEFCPTPRWPVARWLEQASLPPHCFRPGARWLEPHAGKGAIIAAVNSIIPGIIWTACEIRQEAREDLEKLVGAENVYIGDFRRTAAHFAKEIAAGRMQKFDVAITNPAFSLTSLVRDDALMLAMFLAMLVPTSFLGSAERQPKHSVSMPATQKILPDRPSFTESGETDSRDYCWIEITPWCGPVCMTTVLGLTSLEERKRDHAALFGFLLPDQQLGLFDATNDSPCRHCGVSCEEHNATSSCSPCKPGCEKKLTATDSCAECRIPMSEHIEGSWCPKKLAIGMTYAQCGQVDLGHCPDNGPKCECDACQLCESLTCVCGCSMVDHHGDGSGCQDCKACDGFVLAAWYKGPVVGACKGPRGSHRKDGLNCDDCGFPMVAAAIIPAREPSEASPPAETQAPAKKRKAKKDEKDPIPNCTFCGCKKGLGCIKIDQGEAGCGRKAQREREKPYSFVDIEKDAYCDACLALLDATNEIICGAPGITLEEIQEMLLTQGHAAEQAIDAATFLRERGRVDEEDGEWKSAFSRTLLLARNDPHALTSEQVLAFCGREAIPSELIDLPQAVFDAIENHEAGNPAAIIARVSHGDGFLEIGKDAIYARELVAAVIEGLIKTGEIVPLDEGKRLAKPVKADNNSLYPWAAIDVRVQVSAAYSTKEIAGRTGKIVKFGTKPFAAHAFVEIDKRGKERTTKKPFIALSFLAPIIETPAEEPAKPQEPVWVTGKAVERSGLAKFTHLIRALEDPERSDIRKLPEPLRDRAAKWRKKLKTMPIDDAKALILDLLTDGAPRTFNAIVVTIWDKTADIVKDLAPDQALWALVHDELLEHTTTSPILFRLRAKTDPAEVCSVEPNKVVAESSAHEMSSAPDDAPREQTLSPEPTVQKSEDAAQNEKSMRKKLDPIFGHLDLTNSIFDGTAPIPEAEEDINPGPEILGGKNISTVASGVVTTSGWSLVLPRRGGVIPVEAKKLGKGRFELAPKDLESNDVADSGVELAEESIEIMRARFLLRRGALYRNLANLSPTDQERVVKLYFDGGPVWFPPEGSDYRKSMFARGGMCPDGWFKPRAGWSKWESPNVAMTASHAPEAPPDPPTPDVAPSVAEELPSIGKTGLPERETIGGHDVINATKFIELPEGGSFLILENPAFLDPSMAYLAGDGYRLSPLSVLGLPPQSKGPFDVDTIKLMRARYLLQKGLLVLSWDGLESHRKSLFKKTWFPDGHIWPLDSEKPFFRALMAEARSNLPPKAPLPPPEPCRGGAWGNPDGCVSHEGLPIGDDGKCFWGREPGALERSLSKLATGEEPLSNYDVEAVLQELEVLDEETPSATAVMSPHCPYCKTDKARPFPGFEGWADCTGCGTSWRIGERSRGKTQEMIIQERQIKDLANVRFQLRECQWSIAEAQANDDFDGAKKIASRIHHLAKLESILLSAATAA